MKFIDDILYDSSIKIKKRDKILRLLSEKKTVAKMLFVTRVNPGTNVFEIIPSKEIYRLERYERQVTIVGVVNDMEAAIMMITDIFDQLVGKYQQVHPEDFDKEYNIQWL